MSVVAVRGPVDAVAGLDPADRALLSLALTRGLDDARIAQLTGVGLEAVRARRERVVCAVAAQLRILPGEVPTALRPREAPAPATAAGRTDGAPPRLTSPPPSPLPPPPPSRTLAVHAGGHPSRGAVAAGRPRTRAGRRSVIVTALTGLAALGVVLLVIGGGSSRHRAPRIRPAPVAGPATRTTPTPTTRRTPERAAPSPVTPRRTAALRPLAGGPRHSSGTLTLSRRNGVLTLDLRVRLRAPSPRHHYEAYLYDSILRSRSLGRVRPRGITRLRLPPDAARYRDIDVSDQPRGTVNPSGESRLRGPNPARAYGRGARRGSRSRAPTTR